MLRKPVRALLTAAPPGGTSGPPWDPDAWLGKVARGGRPPFFMSTCSLVAWAGAGTGDGVAEGVTSVSMEVQACPVAQHSQHACRESAHART